MQKKLRNLVEEVALRNGVDIVGVEVKGRGSRTLLRLTLDKESGVTLSDCERVSREVGVMLDVEDMFPESYTLEVTSPGIDRPLKGRTDFLKNIGKLLNVVTAEKISNENFFRGRLQSVEEDSITLTVDKRIVAIPIDNVSRAKVEIEIR
ncbi:MAG: ribosome maturation factor RimP [Nitrospirae bacterium]|nr:ribosome maturation factor RimP [Nitrospirota bacterium]MBF0535988.1 ribosome maturation factor RimP [Nitrospirota bacterium]MBF0617891.1 ribosome maturation factor RimP [Nitrospirota bacterium]